MFSYLPKEWKPENQTAYPLLRRSVADVCYILWFNSDWNIHLRPCWIVLHDFQGKTKIAAITANNDGCWENSYLNIRGKPLLWLSFSMFNITRGCICFKIKYWCERQFINTMKQKLVHWKKAGNMIYFCYIYFWKDSLYNRKLEIRNDGA